MFFCCFFFFVLIDLLGEALLSFISSYITICLHNSGPTEASISFIFSPVVVAFAYNGIYFVSSLMAAYNAEDLSANISRQNVKN